MLSAFRNFLLTFAIAALIFGVIAYAISGFIVDTTADIGTKTPEADALDLDLTQVSQDGESSTSDKTGPDMSEVKGESFNVLFIGTDYRESLKALYSIESTVSSDHYFAARDLKPQIDFLMIMKVDKENCKFVLSYIPTNLRVIQDGEYKELRELYANNNEQEIKGYIEANTGVSVDYYINLNLDNFESFVNAVTGRLNGFSYKAPCDIVIEDKAPLEYSLVSSKEYKEYRIEIKKGEAIDTAEEALALLRYNGYTSSSLSRESVSVSFVKAMLEAYTKYKQEIDVYKSLLSFIINNNYTNTNLTPEHIENNIDLLFMYPQFETVTVTFPGTYENYKEHRNENESKKYFTPDVSKAVDLLG